MGGTLPETTEVLIVGCGPVGAVLAIMLGERGVKAVVIDRATDIFPQPRAIAFDSDAIRILQSIGMDEKQFRWEIIPYVLMNSPIFGTFGRINTSRVEDTHPIQITFYQPEFEEALRRRIANMSDVVTMTLGVEFSTFVETGDGIEAEIKVDGVPRKISARYIVGADGANSTVRNLIGKDFKGRSYSEDWLIVDALPHSPGIRHIEFTCDPARPSPHMPAPGGRERWEFMLAKGETRQEMETDASIDRLLKPWGGLAAVKVERRAVYRFHARLADSFQKGRAFLAGDAAHITPPFVGQGLVSGLRDAFNLSWKLEMAIRGTANLRILDSYTVERRPHAQAMINMAKKMGGMIMPRNYLTAFFIHGLMRIFRMIPGLRSYLEDLGIKPANRFSRGLFSKPVFGGRPRSGAIFPQVWLRDFQGNDRRSDEVFGNGFAVLGFGVDPLERLGANAREALNRIGAQCWRITGPGDKPLADARQLEDSERLLVKLAPQGTVVILRPDKTVMGAGFIGKVDTLIENAVSMLES
jgi:3-(3-hydroxy-phenyl)propionate hydroxylase